MRACVHVVVDVAIAVGGADAGAGDVVIVGVGGGAAGGAVRTNVDYSDVTGIHTSNRYRKWKL